jgi:hypothetical protein
MNMPRFTSEAALYQTSRQYRGTAAGFSPTALIVPAIPPCRNCDYICDLCVDRGVACGACALCAVGDCDPCPP